MIILFFFELFYLLVLYVGFMFYEGYLSFFSNCVVKDFNFGILVVIVV